MFRIVNKAVMIFMIFLRTLRQTPRRLIRKVPAEQIFDPASFFQMIHAGYNTSSGAADGNRIGGKGLPGRQGGKQRMPEIPALHPGVALLLHRQVNPGEVFDKMW